MPIVGLSHPRASTRVPDPIHGVIELTVFDRDIVDSRPFQRLHFVLQQSVSYTSFPSNKNTRFPHSLGTAHTVGRMFSSALSNSAPETLRSFLKDGDLFLSRLVDHVSSSYGGLGRKKEENSPSDAVQMAHKFTISGASGFRHSPLSAVGGVHLQNSTEWRVAASDPATVDGGRFSAGFVIDTIWQALRIYALTHDIGHLPMSHAFENAIGNVPTTLKERFSETDKETEFKELMSRARTDFSGLEKDEDKTDFFNLLTEMIDADQSIVEAQVRNKKLHELRSFSILNKILVSGSPLSDGFPKLTKSEFCNSLDLYSRLINNLALCIVYSQAMVESGDKDKTDIHPASFLYAVRQLVDGSIDGDRLDYTLRDCYSAGAQFGGFDLERIIRNCIVVERRSQRKLTTKEVKKSGAKGGKPPQNGLTGCKLYAFGFGPQALPGIEQFFEARYQSYKYLVHHKTASRSNIAMEALIEHLFVYCMASPGSECAKILQQFRYVERDNDRVLSVLPVFDEAIEEIDDASLRSLLHQVRKRLVEELGGLQSVEAPLDQIASTIITLCDVVLYRDFRHIVTLFRDQTPEDVIEARMGQTADEAMALRTDVASNLSEFMTNVRKESNDFTALGLTKPVVIMYENAAPKVFRYEEVSKSAFEDVSWLWDPGGYVLPIGSQRVSATLASMEEARVKDAKLRLYAVSENIRENQDAVSAIEDMVIKELRDWPDRSQMTIFPSTSASD